MEKGEEEARGLADGNMETETHSEVPSGLAEMRDLATGSKENEFVNEVLAELAKGKEEEQRFPLCPELISTIQSDTQEGVERVIETGEKKKGKEICTEKPLISLFHKTRSKRGKNGGENKEKRIKLLSYQ